MKKAILLLAVIIMAVQACQNEPPTSDNNDAYTTLQGKTMGTTYSVIYSLGEDYQVAIDSLLKEINAQVNTYDPTSMISQFNDGEELVIWDSMPNHFQLNFSKANAVYDATNGTFDPTVMPLVSYWGFGKNKRPVEHANEDTVKLLLSYVGLNKLSIEYYKRGFAKYIKDNPNTQLDFSAIAKGYAVDQVAELLASKGADNYLVEIGGETVVKGINSNGKVWTLGINTPKEGADPRTDFEAILQLNNKAIATSGNYRNYYEVDGKKYAHTINPKTGYSEMSNLLSASVIMDDCMSADAYATAFMVMGLEKALELATADPAIEAYLIYDENGEMKVKYTDGLETMLLETE